MSLWRRRPRIEPTMQPIWEQAADAATAVSNDRCFDHGTNVGYSTLIRNTVPTNGVAAIPDKSTDTA